MNSPRPVRVIGLLFLFMWLCQPVAAQADYGVDCADFSTSHEAQEYYDSQGGLTGGDPDGLDRDQDGYACDFGPSSSDAGQPATDESGVQSASNEGGFPLWGTLLVVAGGVAIWPALLGVAFRERKPSHG